MHPMTQTGSETQPEIEEPTAQLSSSETAEEPLPPDMDVELNGKAVRLSALLECLLFVADTPVEPAQIAQTLGISREAAETALRATSLASGYLASVFPMQPRSVPWLVIVTKLAPGSVSPAGRSARSGW